LSRDGGDSWRFITDGLHAHYARAVAVARETVLVSASTGPQGRRSALYRKPLDGETTFVRCSDGLPWFDDNIDSGCLAADGLLVAFGTHDGRVFRSLDEGARWTLAAKGLPTITAVTILEEGHFPDGATPSRNGKQIGLPIGPSGLPASTDRVVSRSCAHDLDGP